MLLFAFTGITLNHAGQIESKPRVETREGQMSPELLPPLQALQASLKDKPKSEASPEFPAPVAAFIRSEMKVDVSGRAVEWSDDEAYVPMPRPGGDAWLRISLPDGQAEYERTDRGWISYFNDLHKGRNTGGAWRWFIDIFAIACVLFSATGVGILYLHAKNRPMAWPVLGLGLLLPALLALLFIH